jgi:hypothetical protein
MGFNKYFIPEPADFINRLESGIGPREFVAIKKIDAVMGNGDSIKMLDKMYEMVRAGETDSAVLSELKLMLK